MERIDGRGDMELRGVKIRTGVMLHAHGSCEIRSGRTTVLCSAMIEKGVPPFLEGTGKGWLTAEYSMLPASCIKRKQRERQRQDSRGTEIQRTAEFIDGIIAGAGNNLDAIREAAARQQDALDSFERIWQEKKAKVSKLQGMSSDND